jgi:hypothetical protein
MLPVREALVRREMPYGALRKNQVAPGFTRFISGIDPDLTLMEPARFAHR